MVAVLAGGTGGAKLARGMADAAGELRVIANTADDVEVHGVHVSPDPDLVTYWLADMIDERGWGIRDDTWNVMDALEQAGAPAWFRLGDRDLAMCLIRTQRMREGKSQTEAHAALDARVLPMADEPVRTAIVSGGRRIPFQEFMIVEKAAVPIDGVELDGIEAARPTPQVLEALAGAEAIVIGLSNPIISIGPILAVPGMRDAIASSPAPVVAVSPFVGGHAVKGPTDAFCEWAGVPLGAEGLAQQYSGLIDGLVADEPAPGAGIPVLESSTLMDTPEARARLATETLQFARSLV